MTRHDDYKEGNWVKGMLVGVVIMSLAAVYCLGMMAVDVNMTRLTVFPAVLLLATGVATVAYNIVRMLFYMNS